jgi:hypothetical protein
MLTLAFPDPHHLDDDDGKSKFFELTIGLRSPAKRAGLIHHTKMKLNRAEQAVATCILTRNSCFHIGPIVNREILKVSRKAPFLIKGVS